MKKRRPTRTFPISQRELAVYLGISGTLLSMTETGRHGSRQLGSEQSMKMTELLLAHQQSKNSLTPNVSLKKWQDRSSKECARLAQMMLDNAGVADRRAVRLNHRREEMADKEQQDLHWLNTLDLLLAKLPKTKASTGDRLWLEIQQDNVLERLEKNGRLAQVKLEAQIQTQNDKARLCRDMHKKLLQN